MESPETETPETAIPEIDLSKIRLTYRYELCNQKKMMRCIPLDYRIIASLTCEDFTRITLLHRHTIFILNLNVHNEGVSNTRLHRDYSKRSNKFIRPGRKTSNSLDESYGKFCEWIITACIPLIEQLASPFEQEQMISMEEFAFPKVHHIKLLTQKKGMIANAAIDEAPPDHLGRSVMETAPITELGDLADKVERVSASDISIRLTDPDDKDSDAYPAGGRGVSFPTTRQAVYLPTGEKKYFKSFDQNVPVSSLLREVKFLHRASELGLDKTLRIPKLYSIVTSQDGEKIIGMLQDWLPFGRFDLTHPDIRRMRKEMYSKWKEQVMDIVTTLHSHDLIWNKSELSTILVDSDHNAWIYGFDGPWFNQYHPITSVSELREIYKNGGSKEWDIIGVNKVFKDFLTRR
ncbi:hypothetical protein ASPWEDRAFT_45352 [Aspergillus wentii DTO 134E9]|uniref:Protein kinase domain-containing protein n=1 Tax=Aspergillus wentii DTO 134E9 TaxID=1073089 RepID=A0A1L9R960_ASPWE|nr:uncharacterized protein ASPWEDRAFT_45352 [Aspergillus wentii DTO 134E9]KAI9926535.1 hypothetical protein MW887_004303 [Aspergillus wentii]OJJ31418.1 hypothetical protein ASPWEDRAFT_45352 [Aspergillus wentii DTO 134E9]